MTASWVNISRAPNRPSSSSNLFRRYGSLTRLAVSACYVYHMQWISNILMVLQNHISKIEWFGIYKTQIYHYIVQLTSSIQKLTYTRLACKKSSRTAYNAPSCSISFHDVRMAAVHVQTLIPKRDFENCLKYFWSKKC